MARNMLLILCLSAWKDPMATPNCWRSLRYARSNLEEGVAGADRLERQPDGRLLKGARDAERGRRAPGLTEGAVARDEDMVKRGLGQGPARIERLHRGQTCVGGRHDEGPHALAGPGDDDDLVGALGGQDGELLVR